MRGCGHGQASRHRTSGAHEVDFPLLAHVSVHCNGWAADADPLWARSGGASGGAGKDGGSRLLAVGWRGGIGGGGVWVEVHSKEAAEGAT